jgi:hypothetical protein
MMWLNNRIQPTPGICGGFLENFVAASADANVERP